MAEEVVDLRKGERFSVLQPVDGSFSGAEITLLNIAVAGVQIQHAQPLRIGTQGKLAFKHGDVQAITSGRVVWSHFARTEQGLIYKSGVQLDGDDARFALAVNSLIRSGVLGRDTDSLDRKREREERRRSGPKPIIAPR